MSIDTRGVVYIATREPYATEAARSARSIREHHPELPITCFTGTGVDPSPVFDAVHEIDDPEYDFSDSILGSAHCTYDKTLFLDTDTYVAGPIEDIFALLDRHDIALAHEAAREGTASHAHEHDVPPAYPQFNTGVVAYRDTDPVHDLFRAWRTTHERIRERVAYNLNQPAFRIAAYAWDGTIAVLPPEYNFREPYYKVGYACGPVKILHDRRHFDSAETFLARINATESPRVFTCGARTRVIPSDTSTVGWRRVLEKGLWKRKREGTLATLKAAAMLPFKRVRGV